MRMRIWPHPDPALVASPPGSSQVKWTRAASKINATTTNIDVSVTKRIKCVRAFHDPVDSVFWRGCYPLNPVNEDGGHHRSWSSWPLLCSSLQQMPRSLSNKSVRKGNWDWRHLGLWNQPQSHWVTEGCERNKFGWWRHTCAQQHVQKPQVNWQQLPNLHLAFNKPAPISLPGPWPVWAGSQDTAQSKLIII